MMFLVTGFEPFPGHRKNPSAEVTHALYDDDVRPVVLPIDYRRLGPAVAELLPGPFDAVIMLGQGDPTPVIRLERVAINHTQPGRADNTGYAPRSRELLKGGAAAYFSTLPIEGIELALRESGLPVAVSLSAGAYVCNALFYLARRRVEDSPVPCGFIHLPPLPGMGLGDGLPLDVQVDAIRIVLDVLREERSEE